MACCGKSNYKPVNTGSWMPSAPMDDLMHRTGENTDKTVLFKYTGKTGLTAFGSITGKKYRFNEPGAVVAVAYADSYSMIAIPHLQKA